MRSVNGTEACDQCGSEEGPLRATRTAAGVYCPACHKSRADYEEGCRDASLIAIQKLVGVALDEGASCGDILNAVHEEMEHRTVDAVHRALRPARAAA